MEDIHHHPPTLPTKIFKMPPSTSILIKQQ